MVEMQREMDAQSEFMELYEGDSTEDRTIKMVMNSYLGQMKPNYREWLKETFKE